MHGPTCIFWANLTLFSLQLGLKLPVEWPTPPPECDLGAGPDGSARALTALAAARRRELTAPPAPARGLCFVSAGGF
jgi:hypothetical protein